MLLLAVSEPKTVLFCKQPKTNCPCSAVVGVAQDVTEDREHAAKLREMQYLQASQEAKVETERNMTAYFSHELRNRKLL